MKRIIAILGYDRCGKDTLAIRLKKLLGSERIRIISLALPLKQEVASKLNLTVNEVEMLKNNNSIIMDPITHNKMAIRDYIIELATENKKKYGEEYYVRLLLKEILDDKNNDVFIIPDMRFKVEALYLASADINLSILKVESKLTTCGKNNKRYEIDEIPYDDIITVLSNNTYIINDIY